MGKESLHENLIWLTKQGHQKAVLMIEDHNENAKHLYVSMGFQFNGTVIKDEYYYERKL